jgi:hypothetical protein
MGARSAAAGRASGENSGTSGSPDELCAAIGVADAVPEQFRLDDAQQVAFVAAMSAEVVRRWGRWTAA